ncbi:MAG: hypothetical protein RMJ43_07170 [Chloroherpetonaceae bacterium]|nr:hypothetical protein [Chloroherpetonaceae bacterium]
MVGGGAPVGWEECGGVVLEDDGGSGDGLSGWEVVSEVEWRGGGSGFEEGVEVVDGLGGCGGELWLERWVCGVRDGGESEGDGFDGLCGVGVSVALLVCVVEGVEGGGEVVDVAGDAEFEGLSAVAEVDGVVGLPCAGGEAFALHVVRGAAGELFEVVAEVLCGAGVVPVGGLVDGEGVDVFALDVGERESECGEGSGEGGDEHGGDVERVGEFAGVERSGASEGEECEVGGVVSAFDGDVAEGACHGGVGDAEDGEGCLFGCGVELRGELAGVVVDAFDVEREGSGESCGVGYALEEDVGIGDGEVVSFAVGDGSGVGACAVGSDAEGSGGVDVCDGSSSGSDGVDVEHGDAEGDVAEGSGGSAGAVCVVEECDVGAGASHIEGDEVGEAGGASEVCGGDDTAGGSGERGGDGVCGGFGGGERASAGVHDAEGGGAGGVELLLEVVEVSGHDGPDEGAGDGGGGAFVFAGFGRDVGGERDVESVLCGDGADGAFVVRVEVCEEEADGEGLVSGGAEVLDEFGGLARVGWEEGVAPGVGAFGELEAVVEGEEGGVGLRVEGVEPGSVLPGDVEEVLESGGGEECGGRAAAFEEGVGGDGGSVDEGEACGEVLCGAGFVEAVEEALRGVFGCGGAFVDVDVAVGGEEDEVGEGASDVDSGDGRCCRWVIRAVF